MGGWGGAGGAKPARRARSRTPDSEGRASLGEDRVPVRLTRGQQGPRGPVKLGSVAQLRGL